MVVLGECLAYFTRLWNERVNAEPGSDLISMLAHSPSTRNMQPKEFLGNIMLLIVGGNDTTRNSISGGVWFLNQNPNQCRKAAPESAAHPEREYRNYPLSNAARPYAAGRSRRYGSRRKDHQEGRQSDHVVCVRKSRWKNSIENPNSFIIDRGRPRQHISFGFGIHRCVGNRLAEMQLGILWEEILKRGRTIEVVGEPKRVMSNLVRGYTDLPVRIAA